MKNQPLNIGIEQEELVIRIGISTLAYACVSSDEWGGEEITDEAEFAKDVARELEREDEQGSTQVHFLLDRMANKAAENGSLGVGDADDALLDRTDSKHRCTNDMPPCPECEARIEREEEREFGNE